jgi:hypothetical protein
LQSSTKRYLCISIAWILLVCYSILLTSAAKSIIDLSGIAPSDDNIQQIVIFIYGLAVVSFLGGSQIPAVFLKKKSFVIQFGFSATFGLMLLLINILNETALKSFNNVVLRPFFSAYPVVALEYLSIPYLFMIFIDLYLSGRLSAFSWRDFIQFLRGTFFHPRSTFDEIVHHRSILFSLVAVVLVSLVWILRTIVLSVTNFVSVRGQFIPLNVSEALELVSKSVLVVPVMILLWLAASMLVHVAGKRLGGNGGYSDTASLLGFAFFPSVITVVIDFFEAAFYPIKNSLILDLVFLILGFVVTLILWPLLLSIFAIQTSEDFSFRTASLPAVIIFLPLFFLLALLFL